MPQPIVFLVFPSFLLVFSVLLGWEPSVDFAESLARTVDWYLENRDWWQRIRDGRYRPERLGIRNSKAIAG